MEVGGRVPLLSPYSDMLPSAYCHKRSFFILIRPLVDTVWPHNTFLKPKAWKLTVTLHDVCKGSMKCGTTSCDSLPQFGSVSENGDSHKQSVHILNIVKQRSGYAMMLGELQAPGCVSMHSLPSLGWLTLCWTPW